MEMFKKQDHAHLQAMKSPKSDPAEMQRWFEAKRAEFDTLAEDEQSPSPSAP